MYLDARFNISTDLKIVHAGYNTMKRFDQLAKAGRMNMYYQFRDRAKATPERLYIMFEGAEYTYRDIEKASNRLANWLLGQGIKPKDRICMMHQNHPTFVIAWLAITKIGAVAAFINTNLSDDPLLHCLTLIEPTMVLFDRKYQQQIATIHSQLNPSVLLFAYGETTHHGQALVPEVTSSVLAEYADDDVSEDFIKNTSFTDPAIFVYTSRAAVSSISPSVVLNMTSSDRIYTVMPLYHASAAFMGMMTPFYTGATLILSRRFSAKNFWDDITRYKATLFILYGSTEAPKAVYIDNRNEYGSGAVGRYGPLVRLFMPEIKLVKVDPDTEELVLDAKGFLVPCKMNEEGELLVMIDNTPKSLSRFSGYYGNKAATEKKLIQNAFRKGDMYFRSGDILRLTDDGFVYFVDRIGDTFRWKSENVATTEVSAVISVFPGVLEANVYGTLVPGHEGRASMAAISLVDEARFDFAGLAAYLKQKLPSYAVPLFLRVVRTMDVTGTFKQQKVKFRKQGIDVDLIPQDEPLYWLQGTTFVRFGRQELESIKRGESKL
ncbi:hypothetical protein [Absidia glauca]|uniref:AMP-dependent synthetase/ligase domain-containing protein n=1 Tax=Absidia glauca TaxID=4829 RepID=A0A163K771_ABSGL|nr:hypothetical protein [Absidia glauca]